MTTTPTSAANVKPSLRLLPALACLEAVTVLAGPVLVLLDFMFWTNPVLCSGVKDDEEVASPLAILLVSSVLAILLGAASDEVCEDTDDFPDEVWDEEDADVEDDE